MNGDKLWALSLVSRFLKDYGFEGSLEMLKVEAASSFQDLEHAILPSDKPLLAILEDFKLMNVQSKMGNISVNRYLYLVVRSVYCKGKSTKS
jgi:hypothetical protein